MFEVRLLGPVEVWAGGRRAPLGGIRPLAVLSALVVHLGEVLSTERLVDCVWDEQSPATAAALVATHVSAVRRALARVGEAELIRTRPPGYVTDLDPSQVDARRFEELLASGRASAARGRPEEAAELLSEALGLWRGHDALEGLGQSFARIEAARLAELRLVGQEESFGTAAGTGPRGPDDRSPARARRFPSPPGAAARPADHRAGAHRQGLRRPAHLPGGP